MDELWCKITSPTRKESVMSVEVLSYNLNYAHLSMNNDNNGGLFHSPR